ncbi:MAG: hypothetical protein Q7N50_03215, partial [Armatimonadota bacterium]|nr:hypothetical protein [Armatimonadota bacterium]
SNPIGAMLAEGIISGIGWGIGGAAATVGIGKAKKALRKSKVGKKANPSEPVYAVFFGVTPTTAQKKITTIARRSSNAARSRG